MTAPCPHPPHRRGTRGGLPPNHDVCMNCGAVVPRARLPYDFDHEKWQRDVILKNVAEDPNYAPYCVRCVGLVRMRKVEHLFWRCKCGAQHDERTP